MQTDIANPQNCQFITKTKAQVHKVKKKENQKEIHQMQKKNSMIYLL